MLKYRRKDGTEAEADQFTGYEVMGAEGIFRITTMLNSVDKVSHWHAAEETDEYQLDEEEGVYVPIILPEHIQVGDTGWGDKMHIGDYIVKRDNDYYVMAEALFEAIYEEVTVNG